MNTEQENALESPEVFNRQLVQAIQDAPDGHLKNASESSSRMVRRRIRENGFGRLILPFKPVTDADLNQLPNTELPVIIEEMEPESPGAKGISFNDTADTAFYRGDKFVVYFCKITTPEFTKNVDELRTYKSDLRTVITDNALKDMHTEEDSRFVKTIDRIVGAVNGVGAAGVAQNIELNTTIRRSNFGDTPNYIEDRNLNVGCYLANRKTARQFLKWDRNELGGDTAEKLALEGLSALTEAKIMGIRHIFTIKRDLVPDGVFYQFAEPGYLGKAYELMPITMFVEKKKDILRFSAMENMTLNHAARKFACAKYASKQGRVGYSIARRPDLAGISAPPAAFPELLVLMTLLVKSRNDRHCLMQQFRIVVGVDVVRVFRFVAGQFLAHLLRDTFVCECAIECVPERMK